MPTSDVATDLSSLRGRVNHFLASPSHGRSNVLKVLKKVGETGQVLIFGGFLRDLALSGSRDFASDIDAVVAGCDSTELSHTLSRMNLSPTRNKFGGYRLSVGRWKLDLWCLETTWAFRHGHVEEPSPTNLVKTTFFDWDAITFDLESQNFLCLDDYLTRLHDRVLDINLSANPNPIGNIVKAFRYCEKYDAALSSRLARYICDQLSAHGAQELSDYEGQAHEKRVLTKRLINQLIQDLELHEETQPIFPFKRPSMQSSLW